MKSHDFSKLPWVGPLPGDISEVEAFCRIFRAAEQFHNALMDTLCNPLTGECSVSYDIPSEDKPELEDKIVSVLGCMVCLLNKGREDVLSGRSSLMNTFGGVDVTVMEDKLPPLAVFRGEMKRYCESLHVALENYMMPDDFRSLDVWRKLQRLKNVCYDSGFPRGDNCPSHALFANWNPVYLSMPKEDIKFSDSEVAFWSGGQLTDESLKWLMDNGFKSIIDLRAENVKDNFCKKVMEDALFAEKVEFIELPVELGTAPSMEQVEKFAALVSDSSKRPIYLHSKEGMWRTSAMVSRWRQYMARNASQILSNQTAVSIDVLSRGAKRTEESHVSSKARGRSSIADDESGQLSDKLCSNDSSAGAGSVHVSPSKHNYESNGVYNGSIPYRNPIESEKVDDCKEVSSSDFYSEVNPHKAQVPPFNIFSKKEMDSFFRSKKLSPSAYFSPYHKRMWQVYGSRENVNGQFLRPAIIGSGPDSKLIETGSSNGSIVSKNLSQQDHTSNETYQGNIATDPISKNITERKWFNGQKVKDPISGSGELGKNEPATINRHDNSNTEASVCLVDDEMERIEGNMCASATGVVRVQSRKKAEMFLVRTDGFSCARERVTESSLAFTHPSTQQQMLLWKSTPKTVLLLKKLGQELMEEAKQVTLKKFTRLEANPFFFGLENNMSDAFLVL